MIPPLLITNPPCPLCDIQTRTLRYGVYECEACLVEWADPHDIGAVQDRRCRSQVTSRLTKGPRSIRCDKGSGHADDHHAFADPGRLSYVWPKPDSRDVLVVTAALLFLDPAPDATD